MQKKAKKPGQAPVEELNELLRSSGLRCTTARIVVLEHLHQSTEPRSHAELFAALESKGLDRATLYRNLMDLAEVGIVGRTDLGDHVWRFELKKGIGGVSHSDEHPHFVCNDCGVVSCLPDLSVELKGTKGAPRSVTKNNVTIQLKGLCDDCV